MDLNFSAWSIRKPIPAILLFFVLCVLGLLSFSKLPVTRFPNIDVPIVAVTITQAGAAPAEMETQIAKRVEDAVANITGAKRTITNLTDGQTQVLVEFRLEINSDRALNDVKDAVARIRADLPRTIDEPIISKLDVEGQSIMTYAASSPGMTLEQLSWHVDDVIARELQGLRGVGRIDRYGGVDREIRISLDPDRLLAFGATAAEVNRQIRAVNVDLAGGRGEVGGQEQSIRTLAGARSVDDLRNAKIMLSGGREVRLSDLGKVEDANSEPRSFARVNGQPIVAFAVFRAKGSSELSVRDVVEARLTQIRQRYPDVTITPVDDAVSFTHGNYVSAMHTLLEGAALAVIVVFAFLRNWRATLITAIALPLSAIPTFWAMDLLGFSLNLVSLLGITLVTGILVDDAIVEIENIVRHMNMGKSPYRAAMEAADEIGLAVIAITFTIVAIFAPVSYMGGIAGQYFKQFGLTVAVAVLFSLLVARLITPMMAAYLMKPTQHKEQKDGVLMRAYLGLLAFSLKRWRLGGRRIGVSVSNAYITLVVGFAFLAGSIWATTLLPTAFMPDEDNSRIVANVELPPGSTLEETRRTTDQIVARLREHPEVRHVYALGGSSATGQREIRRAALFIRLVPKTERAIRQKEFKAVVAERLAEVPDIRAWYVNERGERELAFSIMSRDGDKLEEAVARLEARLRQVDGFLNVASTGALTRPEIRVARTSRRRPNSASRPSRSRKRCASPPSATPAPTSRASTPGTGWCRSACSSTRKPARTSRGCSRCASSTPPAARSAEFRRRHQLRRRPVLDRPLRPRPPLDHRRGPDARPAARHRAGDLQRHRQGGRPARRRLDPADRRRRDPGRGRGRLHPGHGDGPDAGAGRADPALRLGLPAHHHPALAAALLRRRGARPLAHQQLGVDAGLYRPADADGHRDQERHHAGRLRGRVRGQGRAPHRGADRRRPQAGAPHRDDHHRDGGGHAAGRLRHRRWRRVPRADGHRGDLGPARLHRAELVFVPAFYTVMDDLSRLVARIFRPMFGKAEDESQWRHDDFAPAKIPGLAGDTPPPPANAPHGPVRHAAE